MRLILTKNCTEGMVVAKAIYRANGTILINQGMELKKRYIEKMQQIGIGHIYIEDKSFNEYRIDDVVKDETRQEAIELVNNLMENLSNSNEITIEELEYIVKDIISELLSSDDIIVSLAEIRSIDDYTFGHSVNVGILSIITGISMNYTRDKLFDLGLGAILHDIGKTRIPLDILNKPERLTKEEFEIIKSHTTKGYEILKYVDRLNKDITSISLYHHERYDGKGYPNGLKGKEIPEFSRIVSLVDVYDALTNDRIYRAKLKKHETIEYIVSMSNKQFDPYVIENFIQNISLFSIGEGVLLNTGEKGYIININKKAPTKPTVRIICNVNEKKLLNPYILDLSQQSKVRIVKILEIDDV